MITSSHNPLLKEIRRLQRRRADGRFVAEGEDLIAAASDAGWVPVHHLRAGIDVEPHLLDAVSGLGSGSRVLAVYEERWGMQVARGLCVALWGVGDPGNVGAVLRSAQAFGAGCVAIGPGTADPFGPKAVRASMGALFGVPVVRVASVKDLPGPRVALVGHEGIPIAELGPGAARTLLVGAERTGLPDAVVAACEHTAQIPIHTESLNAAMAATVALYEVNRVPHADE